MKSTLTRTPLGQIVIKQLPADRQVRHNPELGSGQAIPTIGTGQVLTKQRKL